MIYWQEVFSRDCLGWHDAQTLAQPLVSGDIFELKRFLDAVHIRYCLVKPYQEEKDYPLVEGRELLPSFEGDIVENKNLPGFSLVAFARPLDYFSEIFQYDKLHPSNEHAHYSSCPLENYILAQNRGIIAARLPRAMRAAFQGAAEDMDVSSLGFYPALLPYLLEMDRAHVFSLDSENAFHLAGVFASFPSDINSELKRFGVRIGKFVNGDSSSYERNRQFVYQYLMELYGFPIVSERRTSSALFARRLHHMGERFLVRVLGQTDRALTTYISNGKHSHYPKVEKIALVRVDADQKEAIDMIDRSGFFLDSQKRVIIMRITYRQHGYDPSNLRQERALSVAAQEILHPLTGESLPGLNIIGDASNMFLRLNDIVRGEYTGKILYKRIELIENTDTDEKRLKFLYSWLTKHQRRMITYADDYYSRVEKVVDGYLQSSSQTSLNEPMRELRSEVCEKMSYIRQARMIRAFELVVSSFVKGKRVSYRKMTADAVAIAANLQLEIINFFPDLARSLIKCLEPVLRDRYLLRTYVENQDKRLTRAGEEIRDNYRLLASLIGQIKSVERVHAALNPEAFVA